MSDAATYLKRGRQIQSQRFGRAGVARAAPLPSEPALRRTASGTSPDSSAPGATAGTGLVVVDVGDPGRAIQQLPMKKKTAKRARSASEDREVETPATVTSSENEKNEVAALQSSLRDASAGTSAPLELTSVASPTAPVPQVEGVTQRINLMAKWFPASLQERKLDAAIAPSATFVEATVERVNRVREYVLTLRYGIDDVEALLEESRQSHPSAWTQVTASPQRRREYWDLSRADIRSLVRAVGVRPIVAALTEFVGEAAAVSPASAASAVYRIAALRRRVTAPATYNIKGWHEYLNASGPESGRAPRLSDTLWLSAASTTAMFTTVVSRLLRGARTFAEAGGAVGGARDGDDASDTKSADGDSVAGDRPRFYDNTEDADAEEKGGGAEADRSWLLSTALVFDSALTPEQRAALSFLRFLMPTAHATPWRGDSSTGYGVWVFAAFAGLDIPLDPDTDRLANDLFRTCCRHLRTLGEWQRVSGSRRDALLEKLGSRSTVAGSAARPLPTYASLRDVCKEDVLAIYTIVVALARFFRQNQDHFIPL